jgi:putative oxidoreductase
MLNKLQNTDLAALMIRIIFRGLMLVNHGWGKFDKISSGNLGFPDPLGIGSEISLYLAVFSEVICAALVTVGLFTRAATIPLVFTMGVAFFVVHGGDAFAEKESSFMYLLGYLAIIFIGPGKYSMDRAFRKKM